MRFLLESGVPYFPVSVPLHYGSFILNLAAVRVNQGTTISVLCSSLWHESDCDAEMDRASAKVCLSLAFQLSLQESYRSVRFFVGVVLFGRFAKDSNMSDFPLLGII